jgi:CheY-like chemotaxis protein
VALRCLIVDDNAHFLGAASDLLEREGVTVVDVASTSAEALRRAAELRPDVVLVDITLAGESGFDLARRLDEGGCCDGSAVILISTHEEADFADLIAESPAKAFLPKSELSVDAIRRILDGCSR